MNDSSRLRIVFHLDRDLNDRKRHMRRDKHGHVMSRLVMNAIEAAQYVVRHGELSYEQLPYDVRRALRPTKDVRRAPTLLERMEAQEDAPHVFEGRITWLSM